IHGVHVLGLIFLSSVAEGALSQELAEDISVSSLLDVTGHWTHGHEHESRTGSALRDQIIIQAHAEVSRRKEIRPGAGQQVSPAVGYHPVDRVGHRNLFRVDSVLCRLQPELHHRSIPAVVRAGILVYGPDVTAARPFRALLTAGHARR